LHGLAEIYKKQGKKEDQEKMMQLFNKQTKNSDFKIKASCACRLNIE